jgi:hypothetical protein
MSTGIDAVLGALFGAAVARFGLAYWAWLRREWAAYAERRPRSAPDGQAEPDDQASREFLTGDYRRPHLRGDE